MRQRSTHTVLLFAALGFYGAAGVTWIVREIAVRHEVARGSGEIVFAALGMLFGLPILLFLGAGAICMLVGGGVFLHRWLTSSRH